MIKIIPTKRKRKRQGDNCSLLQGEHNSLHIHLSKIHHNNPNIINPMPMNLIAILPLFIKKQRKANI